MLPFFSKTTTTTTTTYKPFSNNDKLTLLEDLVREFSKNRITSKDYQNQCLFYKPHPSEVIKLCTRRGHFNTWKCTLPTFVHVHIHLFDRFINKFHNFSCFITLSFTNNCICAFLFIHVPVWDVFKIEFILFIFVYLSYYLF